MRMFPPANGTETIAEAEGNGTYKLSGYKWFSSATDADMTLTLARICDSHENTVPVSSRHFVCAMYYPLTFVFTLAMTNLLQQVCIKVVSNKSDISVTFIEVNSMLGV